MTRDDDAEVEVRRWLDLAVDGEPALGIDKDAVLRAGHRQVRRRRLLASAGVAVAVVVVMGGVVAGQTLLGGPGPGVEQLPAAASGPTSGPTAPVGPDLPVSSPTVVLPVTAPTSVPATTDGKLVQVFTYERADHLSAVFAAAGLIPRDMTALPTDNSRAPLEFRIQPDGYLAEATLIGARGEGSLAIRLSTGGSPRACAEPACGYSLVRGMTVASRIDEADSGLVVRTAWARRADGCEVSVVSSNRPGGAETPRPNQPPLDLDLLVSIATLPGLTIS